jgi:hypothetical protein
LDACADPMLFAPWFKDRNTWTAWFVFLAALFALPMTPEQEAIYQKHTGRTELPTSVAREAWLVCGRRAGKSFTLALIAVFLACFIDWRPFLAPGESGFIVIVAADRKQSKVILKYLAALLSGVPMLASLVARENAESIELTNGLVIEVATCSYRTVRGRTIIAALCDELAFWYGEDSAEPDVEVLNALRPGMATVPGSMLLCASSPYARRGALYEAHKRHFGKDGDPVLCWQAATRDMNPSVPQSFIDAEMGKDPEGAAAEYLAQFRNDVSAFVSREAVEACVTRGCFERPPVPGIRYTGFVDPSGGSADSFTLAIAHRDPDGRGVLDAIREVRPKFSPDDVVREFSALLKTYDITKIVGDRYAGAWPVERFKVHGITYEQSARPKSEIYVAALPLLNSGSVDLLDNPRLISQFLGLERRTSRGTGRDIVDHARGQHDDVVNAAAGALTHINVRKYKYDSSMRWIYGALANDDEEAEAKASRELWRLEQRNRFILSGGMIR